MRIIEPQQLKLYKPSKPPKSRSRWVVIVLALIVGVGVWQFILIKKDSTPAQNVAKSQNQETSTSLPTPPTDPPRLRILTDEQFRDLYNTFAYPNTTEINSPPSISGNIDADQRIQSLAFGRGYKLRSAANGTLPQTPEGFPLQEKALGPWQELKAAAVREGVALGLVSTFRSVDEQRLIFLQRLSATGITIDEIAAGEADDAVNEVLITTSIPGTSRHHTGYTVDFKCGNDDFNFFASTPCYSWLNKNNYENAKKLGWIPSYPPNTSEQGPEPEAWEFVWVGVDALLENGN